MSCTNQCFQGRRCTCAASEFAAESEGVMPMATGCSFKAAPKPAEPPPVDRKDRIAHLAQRLALSFFYVCTLAAAAGFFTQGRL
jgi:hypothetical protein